MAKIVIYRCDLCDIDLDATQDCGEVGVSWNQAAKMELWPLRDSLGADKHLCRVCVEGLREALKEGNDVAG